MQLAPRLGMSRRGSSRRVAAISLVALLVLAPPATAHPSDFETLTLDLLVGPDGLEVIDAAVVASTGPSYEPFPSSQSKHDIAVEVLTALDVPPSAVELDPEQSERYHQVGFLVRFAEPSLGVEAPLRIETAELQAIAAGMGLGRLKLSVCGVVAGAASPDADTLSQLDIQASRVGRSGDRQQREACEIWTVLAASDQPVSVVVSPRRLAETGFDVTTAVLVALAVLVIGAALRVDVSLRR